MELLQLHYFRTVARLEHMTKAAEELHIAQPALSKTIARLEEDLGVPLFDRQSRKIRLNTFGKAFLGKVETALTVLDEGRREVADLAGMKRGSIAIATTTLNRLSKALGAFRLMYPEIRFRIIQIAPASMEDMVQLLEKGEVDLCFGAASMDRPGIREMPVLHSEVFLAVPPGHPMENRGCISLHEAADEPFIEYKEGHPFRKMNEELCQAAGIKRLIACEVEDPAALSSLVQAGLGVAFVPACKGDEEPLYTHLQIDQPDCHRDFMISWLEKRYISLAAREFQRFLVHYFSELQKT
ncbi:LysR family transcriptional regulator [Paenibacillus mendelii]|uniref:LysR family transcriptional regulator n=1 Tax=Paenibacillus mendelii TaxID=206163 RepID=A0ABV6J5C4_9BACL|nr:LysR family transcriptional regulator [Paenibacillus mendelii]MCQ6560252.1 LysR family transcriptional regulator [Paenibacillus mendelii]